MNLKLHTSMPLTKKGSKYDEVLTKASKLPKGSRYEVTGKDVCHKSLYVLLYNRAKHTGIPTRVFMYQGKVNLTSK